MSGGQTEFEAAEILLDGEKLKKRILIEGDGNSPQKGDEVVVHYVGTLQNGKKFDSSRDRDSPFSFQIGVGQVIKGWDKGVASMKQGEKSIFTIHSDLAYGDHGSPPTIPPKATLIFEVELISFQKAKPDPRHLNAEERLNAANELKEQGNESFKAGQFKQAVEHYRNGLDMLSNSSSDTDEEEEHHPLKLSLQLNLANAYIKTDAWLEAVIASTAAIKMDPNSAKAYYRRGLARMHLSEFDEAKTDLLRAAQLDPKSLDIRQTYQKCKELDAKSTEQSRTTYGRMFA